ncbi:MAG: hypothetical protein ACYC64_18215 [Armatimonadota bacterium]
MKKLTGQSSLLLVCAAVVALACGVASPASAASGSIYATPQHLVLSSGTLGSSTITWSTQGCPTAQVYVSQDGGSEVLFAQNSSGSASAPWIGSESIYVFSLYEGTAHTNLLAWTSVTSHTPPTTRMGMNYWPDNAMWGLTNANWPTVRPTVAADLDAISSLSGTVIRLLIWPEYGWQILPTPAFLPVLTEIQTNLVDLLSMCSERGTRVQIAFGNDYFLVDSGTGLRWWEQGYPNNFNGFCADAAAWVNSYVSACENSPYKNVVISYEYEQEMNSTIPNHFTYLTYLYDNCPTVPKGKRLESPVRAQTNLTTDVVNLANALGSRRLDYVDFHSYDSTGSSPDPTAAYNLIHSYFPHSTIGCGEYGKTAPDSTYEAAQQTWCNYVAGQCINLGLPYYNNWQLWDTSSVGFGYGWGFSKDSPKDVLGSMAASRCPVPNADMELSGGYLGAPLYWGSGGVTRTFTRTTPGITNSYCGRLTVAAPTTGFAWIFSSAFSVTGGGKLFANAYMRSNMINVSIGITEYDAYGQATRQTIWPSYTPTDTNPFSYIHKVGSRSLVLLASTVNVIMTAQGTTPDSTRYMDVDAFSAWVR